MRLYLVEDAKARGWTPFSETRPAGELLYGTLLLRERIERAAGVRCSGYLGCPELAGFDEDGTPPVLSLADWEADGGDGPRLLLLSRYLPPASMLAGGRLGLPSEIPAAGYRLAVEGETAGWLIGPERGAGPGRRGARELALPGAMLPDVWTLMARNPGQITRDLQAVAWGESSIPGVHRLGDHAVTVGGDVQIDPGVVLDARGGPIHLCDGVRVRSFTRVEGPAWIGPDSHLLGGVVSGVSCGPVCRLHGEIHASVILGYSNKAHGGYLGHALVGRWVNLGAGTTNSDLKNNYGTVRVAGAQGLGEVDTGLRKVGVALGDHVKTGIGTLLNTGTVVGAGSNLFGGAMPPRWVPPFSWGAGSELTTYRLDRFLDTVGVVMSRRGVAFPEGTERLLTRLWESTRGGGGE
jgi:UDP-N-acetylglucosamine diphosphorylase / glucose-1-phosphate thymidylyltransferase / UDP-N-acetylgalactosamine diphosphorylase / glucosamine-1-phosphate N-acetyltransferase / galactosamine-1-phosphate N-acetyltransferase